MSRKQLALPSCDVEQKFCIECGNYLSVGPIMVTPEGDYVCGRCPKPRYSTEYASVEERTFKCVNHGAGCREQFTFDQNVKTHEEVCEFRKEFHCPSCHFVGNGCQLLHHFGRLHANAVVQGRNLRQILSYDSLENFVDTIKAMSSQDVEIFIRTVPKMFSVCILCEKLFYESNVYVCPKYHVACASCSTKLCPKCELPSVWDKNTTLHGILVQCEWCMEKLNIFVYGFHKTVCQFRRYKCPKKDCPFVGDLSSLKNHWHLTVLQSGTWLNIKPNSVYYWLTPYNDILYVTFKNGSPGIISIKYEDVISSFFTVITCNITLQWTNKVAEHTRLASITYRDVTFEFINKVNSLEWCLSSIINKV